MDQRTGQPATASDGGGTGGGSGGGGEGLSAGASQSQQPSPDAKPEPTKPRSLFSDVAPPAKDASIGVNAPSQVPDARSDSKERLSGASGNESRPDAAQPKDAKVGGKGEKGIGSGDSDPTATKGTNPDGALTGGESAAPSATEASASPTVDDEGSHGGAEGAAAAGSTAPQHAEIEMPEFEVERIEGDGTIFDRSGETERRSAHPVTGIWEQVAGPNDADFAPGGYERSVLMLNPALKTAAVYRVFRGDISLVIGGELALDVDAARPRAASGSLEIREDASSTSRFRKTPLALGGSPAITVVPPSGDGPWSLEWKREGMELAVGGKRYTAITRDAFEKVRRGGGDIASEADKADRVAARPPEATTQRINETSFFGLRGGGKRICFIVDVSGSMAGPKLDRLKQELVGTIQSLKPDTQFAIVFFDSFTNTISQQWMKTDADRQNAVQVITNQGAGSGTDPTGAFEFAFGTLNPLPDCIYYMTDGQTNADVVGILRLLNKGPNKTTVHAIAFGDQSLEMTMKQIAADNNGAYLFVP